MQKKILGSFIMASCFLGSVNAADFVMFGHIGGFFDKGFGKGNEVIDAKDDKSKTADYTGLSAQLGIDVGFGNLHIGAAGWGVLPIWGSPTKFLNTNHSYAEHRYTTKYADLSDLYVKYDGEIQLAIGRFDNVFLGSDWIIGHTQGVGVKWDTRYFGAWATWVNDFSTFGYQSNRFGSELSSFNRYSSSFNNFGVGDNDLFAGGVNIDLGMLKIDPFVHYWLGGYFKGSDHSMLQAGTKVALELGNDKGIKSITSLRFIWQNIFGVNNDDTTLLWVDEELRFNDMFKIGGGWYSVGKYNGIFTINDNARFYGRAYLTGAARPSYFFSNENSWYVFTGLELEKFKIDVLYAGGDYKEFSAIASWNVFDVKGRGSSGYGLQIGGGYVNNGFVGNVDQQNNVVVFAKLFF